MADPKKAAKKTATRKKRPQPKKQPSPKPSPLPEPVDVPQPSSPQPQQDDGLLGGIRNLFQQAPASPAPSEGLSTFSTSEPLSAESERILDSIPAHIGGEADNPGGPASFDEGSYHDPIAALMQQVTFEPQDVQDQLEEFFDWLAERFESDHWKLTERQARMLGRPTAQLLDSVWAKLCAILPDVIARWCASTPGATAFLLAAGIVITPKITKQIAISRSRVTPKQPVPVQHAEAPQPKRSERPEWAAPQS